MSSSTTTTQRVIESRNPATGKVVATYANESPEVLSQRVKRSRDSFERWKDTDISDRAKNIRNLGTVLRRNKDDYAGTITSEMGKPIKQSKAEIEKCAWLCDYYADHSESFLRDEYVPTEYYKTFVAFEPLGIIAGIMPWNFPFWQVMRFAIPAISAGNTAILKHSSKTQGSGISIEQAFNDAGFPDDVFQTAVGDHSVGEQLVQSNINGVSITGSVRAGKRVAELASKGLKKFVLELGGSDPFVVLEDADIDQAAQIAVRSRLINTGQSCIAAKRIIVDKRVVGDFTKSLLEKIESDVVIGDPMDPKTTVGPLVTNSQRESLSKQVNDAKSKGANVLVGGKEVADREGWYYEPTFLSDVNHQMDVVKDEVFGPAAPLIIAESREDAIREANNTEFGLGASIWTSDLEGGTKLARQIQSGVVTVNEMVKSDPRMPFGGIRNSGIGRELSEYGIKEFVNIKSVMVKDTNEGLLVE